MNKKCIYYCGGTTDTGSGRGGHGATRLERTLHAVDANGEVTEIHGVITDVSALRLEEPRPAAHEANYQRLFETMLQGVVYYSPDGAILTVNAAAEKILGLTANELRGRTVVDPRWRLVREDGSVLDPDEHPVRISLLTGQRMDPQVLGIYRPDQVGPVWVSITVIPLVHAGRVGEMSEVLMATR